MPTVFEEGPYRFFFYSQDREEPPHIHVRRDDLEAKFWVDPIQLEREGGFPPHQLRDIEKIIVKRQEEILAAWYEFYS